MSLNRTIRFLGCAAILAAWPAVTLAQSNPARPPAAAPRNLTVDDFFALKDVARAQISPDGNWVAYTVRTLDLAEDKSHTQIWMVPSAGGEALPLTAKGVSSSSPHWSPDGKHLAFLSARGEGAKTQIWTLFMGGGEAQQLTDTIQSVNAFEWSPTRDRIALVLEDPSPEEIDTARRAKAGEKPKKTGQPPWVIDRQQFKFDTVGYLDNRRTHLYVLDVASKKITQVTSGDYDDSEPAWSPDGRFLAFTSNRTEIPDANYNTDIWVVAADNPDKGKNLVRVTTNPGSDHSPAWSPDGKWIACLSQTDAQALDYATHHLVVVPSLGGQARVLTLKLDRNIRNPRFSPDGQSIFAMIEEDGVQPLARISVAEGEITRLTTGRLTVHDFSFSRQGRARWRSPLANRTFPPRSSRSPAANCAASRTSTMRSWPRSAWAKWSTPRPKGRAAWKWPATSPIRRATTPNCATPPFCGHTAARSARLRPISISPRSSLPPTATWSCSRIIAAQQDTGRHFRKPSSPIGATRNIWI
jgi:Tol biopolymer transport system component